MPAPKKNTANPLRDSILRLKELKDTIKSLTGDVKGAEDEPGAEAEVVNLMRALGTESITIADDDDVAVTATVVVATRTSVDEAILAKVLGDDVWEQISTRRLDNAKLGDALSRGLVDSSVLSAASTQKQGDPFVKITSQSKKAPDPEIITGVREQSAAAKKLKEAAAVPRKTAPVAKGARVRKAAVQRRTSQEAT